MRRFIPLAILALAFAVLAVPSAAVQDKPSTEKLLGAWALEVNAGGDTYFLTLEIKETEGKLEAALSEQSGMFTNVPLTDIEWDGKTFKATVKIPTPPDGAERVCKTEMKLEETQLDGTIVIEELGMTAPVTGTKK